MDSPARLGLLELIGGGVTCIKDMGTARHTDVIGEVEASGIHAVFEKALMDKGEPVSPGLLEAPRRAMEDALALADRWHGAASGRLRVALAPRFTLTRSDPLWNDAAVAARATW